MSVRSLRMGDGSNDWATPKDLYEQLDAEFSFDMDPCPYESDNLDGLIKPWSGTVFCNPPYGKAMKRWVEKCYLEFKRGCTVVALLPAKTDTRWFHSFVWQKAEIRFIKGRLSFNEKGRAPFPSMIVVWR